MPLAPVVQAATPRGDARYDVRGMQQIGPRTWTDGTYTYTGDDPSSALANNRPNPTGGVSGGGGGGGGDLLSLAMSSPYYQQVLAANRAAEQAAAAARKAALQQMLIQFGIVPGGFTDPYGDIDQTTRNLAEANTESGISAAARLKQALEESNRDSTRRLTAKGLRRSGARGYQLRRNQLGYDQSYSDAVQQLLGGANSLYSNFAQGQYNRAMNLSSALANAIGSLNFGNSGGGSFAPRVPSSPAPAPQTSVAPGFSLPSGGSPSIKTGGGYYTTPGGDFTSKWQKLAGMG